LSNFTPEFSIKILFTHPQHYDDGGYSGGNTKRPALQQLEVAEKYCSKIISFELPHFMSPDSCYPAAGHLYNRYLAYAAARRAAEK